MTELTFAQMLNKCQVMCSKQERCSAEIRTLILKNGFSDIDACKIIDLLKTDKFIDDQRFADAFVRDKFRFNKWGKRKIEFELRAKKIPQECISVALQDIEEEDYSQKITDELRKKMKTVSAKNKIDAKNKLVRFGLSRGVESGIVFSIVNKLLAESEDC